jgi:hypothetical protein
LRCGVNVSRVSADFSIIGQCFRRCLMADGSTHPEDHDPDQTAPDTAVAGGVAGAICNTNNTLAT